MEQINPSARPWGLTRLVTFTGPLGVPHTRVELDPATQTTRYLDEDDQPLELAKHGTSRTVSTSNPTGGGDGQNPQPPDDTLVTDYEPD